MINLLLTVTDRQGVIVQDEHNRISANALNRSGARIGLVGENLYMLKKYKFLKVTHDDGSFTTYALLTDFEFASMRKAAIANKKAEEEAMVATMKRAFDAGEITNEDVRAAAAGDKEASIKVSKAYDKYQCGEADPTLPLNVPPVAKYDEMGLLPPERNRETLIITKTAEMEAADRIQDMFGPKPTVQS